MAVARTWHGHGMAMAWLWYERGMTSLLCVTRPYLSLWQMVMSQYNTNASLLGPQTAPTLPTWPVGATWGMEEAPKIWPLWTTPMVWSAGFRWSSRTARSGQSGVRTTMTTTTCSKLRSAVRLNVPWAPEHLHELLVEMEWDRWHLSAAPRQQEPRVPGQQRLLCLRHQANFDWLWHQS